MADDSEPPPACPVNHRAHDAWLRQAHAADEPPVPPSRNVQCPVGQPSPPAAGTLDSQQQPPRIAGWRSWAQTLSSSFLWARSASPPPAVVPPSACSEKQLDGLGTTRALSSIPRSSSPSSSATSPPSCPVNHGVANSEIESGADAASGNWAYPSERMFFDAMRRKGYDARAADMKTVVPIHNAVNERAWKHIQQWEAPYLKSSQCACPKLESFANKNDHMTPTARLNTLLGYSAPFDRHDWIIDRCGTRIEYVIDFYAGRPGPNGRPGPSFYLDVRPKLNSWEGLKMRALRWSGLV